MPDHAPTANSLRGSVPVLNCQQPDPSALFQARERETQRPGFSFSARDRRADFVAVYPELDALCDRLGFGWKDTVATWNRHPEAAMLELARAASPPALNSGGDLLSASLSELVEHLQKHHHLPLRCELNRVWLLINRLVQCHPHQRDIQALASGFSLLRDSLMVHLMQEEQEAFPLCERLEAALHHPHSPINLALAEPLHAMAAGHLEMGQDLDFLRKMTLRAGLTHDPDAQLVLRALTAMEQDLVVHTAIENEILLPAALFTCELLASRRTHHDPPGTHAQSGAGCRS